MTIFQVSGYLYVTFTLQAMQHWICCCLDWWQIVSCGEISYQTVPGRQMVPSPLNVNLKQKASAHAFLQTKHCGRASVGFSQHSQIKTAVSWDMMPYTVNPYIHKLPFRWRYHVPLKQCPSTARLWPSTGPWHQLCRAARGLRKLQNATRFH